MTPQQFKNTIYEYYKTNNRAFPWRETTDPYRILVSEIMLQQTQTDCVRKKYEEWLRHFPTFGSLAKADLTKVLSIWQGLGYNRRALALKRTAEIIVKKNNGIFPKTYEEIVDLPGIGPYTAGAVMAFAYNNPIPIIETNIRTVYIHFLFNDKNNINDKEILKHIEKTLDSKNIREWYYALMDYGVMLKKTIGNLSKRSAHYVKQSPFKGSNREIRSEILKIITASPCTYTRLIKNLTIRKSWILKEDIEKNIDVLKKEGFIKKSRNKLTII